jgi:hypothetical protein
MAYSTANPFVTSKVAVQTELHVFPQDETFNPNNADAAASLIKVKDEQWQLVDNVVQNTVTPETEDDEVEYFSAQSKSRIKEKQTKVTKRDYALTLVNYPPGIHAMLMGVQNPFGEEAKAGMQPDSEEGVQIFANNTPGIDVAARLTRYNAEGQILWYEWFYCKFIITNALELNGKTAQPEITLEVQPSSHNRMKYTATYTQQTETV